MLSGSLHHDGKFVTESKLILPGSHLPRFCGFRNFGKTVALIAESDQLEDHLEPRYSLISDVETACSSKETSGSNDCKNL